MPSRVGGLSGAGAGRADRARRRGGVGTSTGSGGSAGSRWSCGSWTPWEGSCSPTAPTFGQGVTGVDDHSRFCISAFLMVRETSQRVCEGLALALRTYGVPGQILTDNGKVFTGRFNRPPVEVLFDRICRENGIEHLLTQPRSPTTTGKIERFHRALRAEFLTDRVFPTCEPAQAELDAWVERLQPPAAAPGAGDGHPGQRFCATRQPRPRPPEHQRPADRTGDIWVARRGRQRGDLGVLAADLSRAGRRRPPGRRPGRRRRCCRSRTATSCSRPCPEPAPGR